MSELQGLIETTKASPDPYVFLQINFNNFLFVRKRGSWKGRIISDFDPRFIDHQIFQKIIYIYESFLLPILRESEFLHKIILLRLFFGGIY